LAQLLSWQGTAGESDWVAGRVETIWIPNPVYDSTSNYAMESVLRPRFKVMYGTNCVDVPMYVRVRVSSEPTRSQFAAVMRSASFPMVATGCWRRHRRDVNTASVGPSAAYHSGTVRHGVFPLAADSRDSRNQILTALSRPKTLAIPVCMSCMYRRPSFVNPMKER